MTTDKILITNVYHEGTITDVLICESQFEKIAPHISDPDAIKIDGKNKAILPPFYNAHSHAAMTLLRGYADDMDLFEWLSQYIWPFEAKMTYEDIYVGSKLAILEMIKSGCVFFNDMYWKAEATIQAVEEMGVRAAIGATFLEGMDELANKERLFQNKIAIPDHIQLTIAPHAIYTVGEKMYRRCAELANESGLILHTHLAETKQEVNDCIKAHGLTPVRYLDKIGVLGPNVVAAHVVHVDDEEIEILKNREVTIVHNPCSNMKLSSGNFRSADLLKAGCKITLGTDGCSSNNNLDMREEMKFAALLAKNNYTPQTLPTTEIFKWATRNAAEAFGIDAGIISEGKLADAVLVDLNNERLVPNHNLLSNWVYAADRSCIDTVICHGKILMNGGYVENEEEIIEQARKASQK